MRSRFTQAGATALRRGAAAHCSAHCRCCRGVVGRVRNTNGFTARSRSSTARINCRGEIVDHAPIAELLELVHQLRNRLGVSRDSKHCRRQTPRRLPQSFPAGVGRLPDCGAPRHTPDAGSARSDSRPRPPRALRSSDRGWPGCYGLRDTRARVSMARRNCGDGFRGSAQLRQHGAEIVGGDG